MKKILSITLMVMFLMSMLPNLVSADDEIQLGQSFHLGQDMRVVLNDENPEDGRLRLIINSENITEEMNLGEGRILPVGINMDWILNFVDDDMGVGGMPQRQRHVEGDVLNVNGRYTINILDINWDEGETARYAEVMVDRIGEIEENIEEENMHFERVSEQQNSPQITEKKEALGEVALKLKEYLRTTKEKVGNSQLISDEEKIIFIEKLDEKSVMIDEYLPRITEIKSSEEVEMVKSRLKQEIREIKPVIDKPTIKIHKDKISKIIDKLERLSKKLEKITSSLDTRDKSKIRELNDLIDSANKNIDKAQKLYKKDLRDTTEIKFLLKQTTKDIKEAFRLVKEILSEMERDILYEDLEGDPKEGSNKGIPTRKELKEIPTRKNNEDYIENIYIELDETFKLYEGQSAKLVNYVNNEKRSVIVTLKHFKGDDGAGTNINYWKGNDHISNEYDLLKENQKIVINGYVLKLLAIDDKRVKYIISKNNNDQEREEDWNNYPLALGVGDIHKDYEGSDIEVTSISINEDSCVVSYDRLLYTLSVGERKVISDGVTIDLRDIDEDKCRLTVRKLR